MTDVLWRYIAQEIRVRPQWVAEQTRDERLAGRLLESYHAVMPYDIDNAKAQFKLIQDAIEPLIANHYNEAKTRIAFIDPIITKALGWDPIHNINYEERYTKDDDPNFPKDENKRCIDYVVSLTEPILVVEAKRNLKQFNLPTVDRTRFKLSGVLGECKNAWPAILQARAYCDHVGARYCLVTNGHQFIAFKALRERGKWTDGYAVVWRSLDEVYSRFGEFYSCLSRETILQDRLTDLSNEDRVTIERHRPRTFLHTGSGAFRNDLYDVLHSAFAPLLLDRSEVTPEFLEKCYVSSDIGLKYGKHLDSIIVDKLPEFTSPIFPVRAGSKKDKFHGNLDTMVNRKPTNPLIVVIGGPGVGKTTFLQWYFRSYLPKLVDKNALRDKTIVLNVDYRKIDCLPQEVRTRTLEVLGTELKEGTRAVASTLGQLKEVYRSEIDEAKRAELAPYAAEPAELEKKIGELIGQHRANIPKHLHAMSDYLSSRCGGKQLVIILDNMDQKGEELQKALYQAAQELVFSSGAIIILSMRESTYQNLQRSPQFNAFSPVQFHVMVQPVRVILDARLNYLNDTLGTDDKIIKNVSDIPMSVGDIRTFMTLLDNTIDQEPLFADCIESLSNGNTREQLKIVYSFLVSGQTKISDYLFRQQQFIPYHEFLSSIIYGDRRLYVEQKGHRFMNVFALGPNRTASHFTVLRTLSWFKHLGQEGDLATTDFLSVDAIYEQFEDQGFSRAEIEGDIQRMASFGLLMPESQDPTAFNIGETFALSKCGLFYLDRLHLQLPYVSAMVADTAWTTRQEAQVCAGMLRPFLNLSKIPLSARLDSTRLFLQYLEDMEAVEMTHAAASRHEVFGKLRFVPAMWDEFNKVADRHSSNIDNS